MTNRLYYTDPYLRAFDASVSSVDRRDDRLVVTLDRTAFYPTSGGQPFDTGTLGGFRVVDVFDRDDATVAHVLETGGAALAPPSASTTRAASATQAASATHAGGASAAPTVGSVVHGEIDWARRFDHMQQHTGQHVLSAAFERLFHARTVSFHLGGAVSTIDLGREVTPAEIAAAESEANRIVWEDRPVTIRFVSAEDAATLRLRKRPRPARDAGPRDVERKESGPPHRDTLRLIEVEQFDLSACGGTHVARTGAIGVIAVSSWERFKGGQRLGFVCGGRALGRFRSLRDAVTASVRLLSVLPEELPGSIERLQADAKEQKRAMAALQSELARYRADELAVTAETVQLDAGGASSAPARLLVVAVDGHADALKSLAMTIAAKPGYVVVLISTARPALVVVARSADVSVSAQQILAKLTAAFGGRGGGKADLAQGGGLDAPHDAILAAARAAISSSITKLIV